ncbi:MAG: hypothetical protein Udaeo2_28480 [Candidatus Udaeobacter sp.]|nr:MAG: hypothetical protein Udaeo2_28480 [Candidatus Udaeobacter sp.]
MPPYDASRLPDADLDNLVVPADAAINRNGPEGWLAMRTELNSSATDRALLALCLATVSLWRKSRRSARQRRVRAAAVDDVSGAYDGSRFSPLDQINAPTCSGSLQWVFRPACAAVTRRRRW